VFSQEKKEDSRRQNKLAQLFSMCAHEMNIVYVFSGETWIKSDTSRSIVRHALNGEYPIKEKINSQTQLIKWPYKDQPCCSSGLDD